MSAHRPFAQILSLRGESDKGTKTLTGIRTYRGFGNIDPLKADILAKELFEYKRTRKLTSEFRTMSVAASPPGGKFSTAQPDSRGDYMGSDNHWNRKSG